MAGRSQFEAEVIDLTTRAADKLAGRFKEDVAHRPELVKPYLEAVKAQGFRFGYVMSCWDRMLAGDCAMAKFRKSLVEWYRGIEDAWNEEKEKLF